MKTRIFTVALLLAASLSGFAQDKASLKAATLKMIDLTDHENYIDLSGTVYPKVFNVVSKDDYLALQQQKINGQDYKIHMIRIDPSIDYGAVKKVDDITYCIVNYNSMMTVELTNKLEPKDREAKEAYFKKLLNVEDVFYIESNNTIDIKKRIQLVAIADESTYGQWTFIDPSTSEGYDLLHEAIRNELNPEYKAGTTETTQETTQEAVQETTSEDKYVKAKKQEEAKKKSVQKKS
jgi:hypothetical protein